MDQCDGVEFSGREGTIDIFRLDVFAPIDLERFGVLFAAARDIEPFIRESAAHATKQSGAEPAVFTDEIANCGLHDTPRR